MWYDTNKLKDVKEFKIIITKRKRKGRKLNEKKTHRTATWLFI